MVAGATFVVFLNTKNTKSTKREEGGVAFAVFNYE